MRIQIACSLFYHSCWFNISDIDECLDRTSCGREAQCQNAPGTFRCNCPNGEPFNAITRSCTSAVACTNNNNCPGNAICTNGACNCPEPNVGPDCEGMFQLLSDLLLGVFSLNDLESEILNDISLLNRFRSMRYRNLFPQRAMFCPRCCTNVQMLTRVSTFTRQTSLYWYWWM